MIKEAIEKILSLGKSEVVELDGYKYHLTNNGLNIINPPKFLPHNQLSTLKGFCDEIVDTYCDELQIEIVINSPINVIAKSVMADKWNRDCIISESTAIVNEIDRLNSYTDQETFILFIMTNFLPSPDRETILQIAGNLRSEKLITLADDGVTQVASVKAGLTKLSQVEIKNPIELIPIRTFQEIEQPKSKFIFRLRDGKDWMLPACAIYEIKDNQWKIEAMNSIRRFIENEFITLNKVSPSIYI